VRHNPRINLTETQFATPLPRVQRPRQRLGTLNDAMAFFRIGAASSRRK
jgi:hypothetical protein